jgi:hypothetical protein
MSLRTKPVGSGSSLLVSDLCQWVLFPFQRYYVSAHRLCVCASGIVSSPMDFVSAPMRMVSGPEVFHSLNSCEPQSPCDDYLGVIKHPGKHYYKYSVSNRSTLRPWDRLLPGMKFKRIDMKQFIGTSGSGPIGEGL